MRWHQYANAGAGAAVIRLGWKWGVCHTGKARGGHRRWTRVGVGDCCPRQKKAGQGGPLPSSSSLSSVKAGVEKKNQR